MITHPAQTPINRELRAFVRVRRRSTLTSSPVCCALVNSFINKCLMCLFVTLNLMSWDGFSERILLRVAASEWSITVLLSIT